jgi:ferrous iron transport protein A
MTIRLQDMAVGEAGRVVGFDKGAKAYRQKLLAMGLTPGTRFSVTRYAPLGDPVEIRVRGYALSLRKGEAAALLVEKVQDGEE